MPQYDEIKAKTLQEYLGSDEDAVITALAARAVAYFNEMACSLIRESLKPIMLCKFEPNVSLNIAFRLTHTVDDLIIEKERLRGESQCKSP